MGDIPYLAVGSDELGPPLGETILCPECDELHPVEYGTSRTLQADGTWSKPVRSNLLGFYKCDGTLYLAGVNGREIN